MDELRTALELATDDELQSLTEILFRRKFNPLDYLQGLDPIHVQNHDRIQWLDTLEDRFRFLAADGFTVLRGEAKAVTYREVLVRVCGYLNLKFSPLLSTTDLEAEIFLHLMQRSWDRMPSDEKTVLIERIRSALQQSSCDPLPLNCHNDPLRLVLEGGGALALSSLIQPLVLRQIAQQFALHLTTYRAVNGVVGSVLVQAARKGVASTAIRYTATRSALAALSGALWVGFMVDLGWRAIATNYGRIIPMIFTLAQIRLTRSEWVYAV